MAQGELHDFSVMFGAMQAQIKGLTDTVAANHKTTIDEHRKVHQIVDATWEAMRSLKQQVDGWKPLIEEYQAQRGNIAEMKTLTDDYRETRAEARGAKRFALALWGLVTSVGGGGVVLALQKIFGAAPAAAPPVH